MSDRKLRGVIAAMPGEGLLEGRDLAAVGGLLLVLGDEARMKTHAARVLAGESVDEVIEAFTGEDEAPLPEQPAEPSAPAPTLPPSGAAIREQPEAVFSFF